ncbi:MAG: hypothetical protein ACI9MR_002546, partial [Myxococcota bacterium]
VPDRRRRRSSRHIDRLWRYRCDGLRRQPEHRTPLASNEVRMPRPKPVPTEGRCRSSHSGRAGIATITDGVFTDNAANRTASIDIDAAWSVDVERSSFFSDTGWRGSVYVGEAAVAVRIEKTTFANGTLGNAPLYVEGTDVALTHVTVASSSYYGLWLVSGSGVMLLNTVFANKGASNEGDANQAGGALTSLGGNVFDTEVPGLALTTNDVAPAAGRNTTIDTGIGSRSTDAATGMLYYEPTGSSPSVDNAVASAVQDDQFGAERP